MRTDQLAVARANMRLRTREENPVRIAPETVQAARERQERLNWVAGHGCVTCCKLSPLLNEPGTAITCPLLGSDYAERLSPEERATAETCRIPALYAEVAAGEHPALRGSDVLPLIPFHVPDGTLEMAQELEAARPALSAGTVPEAPAALPAGGPVALTAEQPTDQAATSAAERSPAPE